MDIYIYRSAQGSIHLTIVEPLLSYSSDIGRQLWRSKSLGDVSPAATNLMQKNWGPSLVFFLHTQLYYCFIQYPTKNKLRTPYKLMVRSSNPCKAQPPAQHHFSFPCTPYKLKVRNSNPCRHTFFSSFLLILLKLPIQAKGQEFQSLHNTAFPKPSTSHTPKANPLVSERGSHLLSFLDSPLVSCLVYHDPNPRQIC